MFGSYGEIGLGGTTSSCIDSLWSIVSSLFRCPHMEAELKLPRLSWFVVEELIHLLTQLEEVELAHLPYPTSVSRDNLGRLLPSVKTMVMTKWILLAMEAKVESVLEVETALEAELVLRVESELEAQLDNKVPYMA
ncbi:hypothetical protein CDL15_Pgr011313 [Punica granatum]|uniref:Uncharacterized protein n=2 Tax=Punica granatum TaxID=22663 RepID=A0A218WET3_PUNGR|nr:hypothetical protein CDL15_Pgr011313 [Punica granatum]